MSRGAQLPQPCAGVVCLRGGEVLLIRRGKPPRQGEWSLPGGRIEWGETAADAALRELREETGVTAELLGLLDVVDGLFKGSDGALERHYLLVDYAARWLSGEPVASRPPWYEAVAAIRSGYVPAAVSDMRPPMQ